MPSFKRLDSRQFEAVSQLFHAAMACEEGQVLRLPKDRGQLLEMAQRQHDRFRTVGDGVPPIERLRILGGLQFRVVAALYGGQAQASDGGRRGMEDSITLLYAGMIQRLLAQAGRDLALGGCPVCEEPCLLAKSFDRLMQDPEEPQVTPGDLRRLREQCAEYLNALAVVVYER